MLLDAKKLTIFVFTKLIVKIFQDKTIDVQIQNWKQHFNKTLFDKESY